MINVCLSVCAAVHNDMHALDPLVYIKDSHMLHH